jgi:hypothetical protein
MGDGLAPKRPQLQPIAEESTNGHGQAATA